MKDPLRYLFLLFILCIVPLNSLLWAAPIKVGVSLPLSGAASSYGIDIRNALAFAAKHYDDGKIELLFEDDQCSGRGAVSVAQKLIAVDGVKYVLGSACSGALLAAAPHYERGKVIVFGIATSAAAISHAGRYIFRMSPSDAVSSTMLAQHVLKSHSTVGAISEQTDYCEGLRTGFSDYIMQNGGKIVDVTVPPGQADFRTPLLKLKQAGVKGVFVNTQSDSTLGVVVQQISQLGWKPQIYAAYFPSGSEFLRTVGPLAEGIEFVDLPHTADFLDAEGSKTYQAFVKEYGEPKSNAIFVPLAIEAFRIVKQLQGQKDPLEWLHQNEFSGMWGKFRFDANGDLMNAPLSVRVIRDGKPVNRDSPV